MSDASAILARLRADLARLEELLDERPKPRQRPRTRPKPEDYERAAARLRRLGVLPSGHGTEQDGQRH